MSNIGLDQGLKYYKRDSHEAPMFPLKLALIRFNTEAVKYILEHGGPVRCGHGSVLNILNLCNTEFILRMEHVHIIKLLIH